MTAVVFDLDGTLIDSAPDMHAAVARMLSDNGLPILDLATVTSFVGNGLPTLVERVMAASSMNLKDHPEITKQVLRNYDEENGKLTTLYPGVLDCLTALHQSGVAMGICTNKPEAPAHVVLEHFDLAQFFPVVIGGDTLPVRKPDAGPLLATFDHLAASADQRIYVGDSEVDAATARAAGVPFALYEFGYRKTAVSDLPHTLCFRDYVDLTAWISERPR